MDTVLSRDATILGDLYVQWLDAIRGARSVEEIRNMNFAAPVLASALALAAFNIHLTGRAQIYQEVVRSPSRAQQAADRSGRLAALVLDTEFEPLPFDEAIDYFDGLVPMSRAEFDRLSDAARRKGFTVAAAATDQVAAEIQDLLSQALDEGLTLSEFQNQAAQVLDRAGVSPRSSWYWETVYRTNLQASYQAGRWKQLTEPEVKAARPYLRYVSARTPTSRPSHVAKHGLILPIDDPFWNTWYPPNGYNCLCSVESVSEDLLERRDWKVADDAPNDEPDDGFTGNVGQEDEI